jgi:lipopolysaccharide export system protein LptA
MSKRLVVVGGATAVAGLVLGASVVFGPAAVTGGGKDIDADVDAPTLGQRGGPVGANLTGIDIKQFKIDEDGEVTGVRLRAKQSNLKPLGITEFIAPHAEVRLGAQRAITITADKADMEMEDRKPRAGDFFGNVVVTIFQAPQGVELVTDPDKPEHERFIQQRIFLDDPADPDQSVHFSIEDDSINTPGPVHATSPQVDFFGVGLRLTYNTQRKRIEQLVVTEGRYLIFNPDAQSPGFDDTETQTADANQERADEDTKPKEEPAGPSQFYLAEFADQVVVRNGIEDELGGERLLIEFSMGTKAVTPGAGKPATPPATSGLPEWLVLPGAQLAQVNDETNADARPGIPGFIKNAFGDATFALPLVKIPPTNAARSLFNHVPKRDLVVTWAGHLRVAPLASKPELLADDEDVRVSLTGENAYAQTAQDGEVKRLETVALQYLLSQELTTAIASEDKPVRILAAALGGEITGQKLVVRQQAGTATILGPGQLNYTDPDTKKPLTLTWQNRLDLELFIQTPEEQQANKETNIEANNADAERSEASGTQTKILGVKTATFDGQVTATHPDFDLAADKLTLAFAEPNKALDLDNTPTEINAAGNIAIMARGDDEDETFDITAQRLTVALKQSSPDDAGKTDTYASAIRADGGVRIEQPGFWMTCQRVSLDLNPPSKTKQNAAEDDRYAQVRNVFAVGQVRGQIDHEGRRVDLVADQLIGDVERDQLTLASNNALQPAEVFDLVNQRKLTGELVEMDNKAEQLKITGTGSLASIISDPANPDATLEDSFLNVAWTQSMMFNNVTGKALFIGDVRSESRRSTDFSELTCHTLDMRFSPDYKHDPRRLIEDEGKDTHDRQVRSATATGDVQFMAAAWQAADPGKVTNRLRLQGPKLIFTNKPAVEIGDTAIETVVVEGAGNMTLEDYRLPEKPKKQADADSEAAALPQPKQAFLTGRGATLFNWDDTMVLDAKTNTATLLGTVQMTHIPKDEAGKQGDVVQLDCQRLVADMTDTGGLSVWLSDDAPDAQVTTITADDTVRVLQSGVRAISSDHLKFDASQNRVRFWSEQNSPIVIEDLERGTTQQADELTWDLTTDQIDGKNIRGGANTLE